MSDQYCASCDEIKGKCKFLNKDDILFEVQGNNLVIKDKVTGSSIGSVSAASICIMLANAGCSLGGGAGGGAMTGDMIAAALCASPAAQAALGACLKDDVVMSGSDITAALCASQPAIDGLASCIIDELAALIISGPNAANLQYQLALAMDNEITANLANDFVPMPGQSVPADAVWVTNGLSGGDYHKINDLLASPPHVAAICAALRSAGCDLSGLAGKTITSIAHTDQNSGGQDGFNYALEGITAVGTSPNAASIRVEVYDKLTGTILLVPVDMNNTQGLGAPTVTSPVPGAAPNTERYFYPLNHSAFPGNTTQYLSHYRISTDGGATWSQWGPVV